MEQPKAINNISEKVIDDLKVKLSKGSCVSIAAASFSIYAFEALKGMAQMAVRQGATQRPLPQAVWGGLQTVPPVRGGGDHISLLPQGLHRLPHRRPADAQTAAHRFSGQRLPPLFRQQRQHLFPTHGTSSKPVFAPPHTFAVGRLFIVFIIKRPVPGRQPKKSSVDRAVPPVFVVLHNFSFFFSPTLPQIT